MPALSPHEFTVAGGAAPDAAAPEVAPDADAAPEMDGGKRKNKRGKSQKKKGKSQKKKGKSQKKGKTLKKKKGKSLKKRK